MATLRNSNYLWANFDPDFQKELLDQGWLIEIPISLFPEVIQIENIEGTVESDEYSNWFELGLCIEINGKKVNLVPINDWDHFPENVVIQYQNYFYKLQKNTYYPS